MAANGIVQSVNINDRMKFSPDARVNQELLVSNELVTRMNCYEPGQVTPMHRHPDEDEVLFVVEGRGAITFKEREGLPVTPGSLISLPAGLDHQIEAAADSRMVLIYVMQPGYVSVSSDLPPGGPVTALPGERA